MEKSSFFQDYMEVVADDEVYLKLLAMERDYDQEKEKIEKQARDQGGNILLTKMTTGKEINLNSTERKKHLENEYKFKSMVMAEPHIDDKAKFKELAKKHSPDQEFIQMNGLQDHPVIVSLQEKTEELTATQKRAKQFEETKKMFDDNRRKNLERER